MKNTPKRLVAFVCAMAMCLGGLGLPVGAETAKERYKRLQKEIATMEQQIKSAENTKSGAEGQKVLLAQQKQKLEESITEKEGMIATTQQALTEKQEAIANKRQFIVEQDQKFQQRLVAIYKMNNSNILSELLNVDSFSEALTVVDNMQRITKNDTDFLIELNNQRQQLEAEQAQIDATLAQLQQDYQDLENNQNALVQNIQRNDATLSAAQAEITAKSKDKVDAEKEAAEAYQAMQAAAKKATGTGSQQGDGSQYAGGKLQWPVPGHYVITCGFGEPDPNGKPHTGIDISGNKQTGARIVAANDGKVIIAQSHPSYGNYIVIDHGDGIKTLYAHCQSLAVSAGQTVAKGDTIATLGSTGFSTGPHLHFEVLAPGQVNPKGWLQA